MRFLRFALTLLLTCCSQPGREPGLPENLEITWGNGGGYSGMWEGFDIRSEGDIFEWSGRVAGENAQAVGMLPQKALLEVWTTFKTTHFFEKRVQQTGDLTRFIQVKFNATTHTIRWPSGVSDEAYKDENQLFDFLTATVRQTTRSSKNPD